ncbi:ATP-binding cassette domain-containing protein [Paraburkholderia sp. USG1]|uniref:iron ABC transporter ATP-binding protein n=1 Tax=Paraburkholderia sp. USG1 TaxID=2952268 RepID=UPI00285A442C|nr:ATP-binding cassette domain-containing protein [Paraburkholderia sp. USG1]MDR8398341.1 ATP-binding cassette domain-containing protein [Paraburkholderia sp. USG1]
MIETRALTKRYGAITVVDNVSVTIPVGGLTSIIGPNGAGKSTFMMLISRLLPATSGSVTVDGMDVATTPTGTLAKRLAILRQDNHTGARLSVGDLVAFGRYPHSKGRLTLEDHDHVERALRYLEITPLRERFIDELSGGQRQRAFIAMVLCQDTDYLLLDEPLNSLDLKHAAATMKILRRAADELGKTVVLVLHDINFASCYSDHIIAMRAGRVMLEGPPAGVMQTGPLGELYEMNIDIHELRGRRVMTYYG